MINHLVGAAVAKRWKQESGYTLIESVVAMSLFAAVLIPLAGTIGYLMLDNSAEEIQRALQVGQTIMSSVSPSREENGTVESVVDKFIVRKSIARTQDLVEVTLTIASTRKPDKQVLVLHKSFLTSS